MKYTFPVDQGVTVSADDDQSEALCPFCGCVDHEPFDHEGFLHDDCIEVTCGECGKDYTLIRYVRITYTTMIPRDPFYYINQTYGLNVTMGTRIEYDGKPGTVVGISGSHLRIILDGESHDLPYHPCHKMTYSPRGESGQ